MGGRRPRRPARRDTEGDLEWYSPFVLRGVMEAKRLTVSRLARLANRNHQTVSNMLDGDHMKRATRSLLDAVASALGEDVSLFTSPPTELIDRLLQPVRDFEHNYSVRTALAAKRVMDGCERASIRDVEYWRHFIGNAEPAFDAAVPRYVRAAFAALFMIRNRRGALLRFFTPDALALRDGPQVDRSSGLWRPTEDPAHESAVVALIESTAHIIRPWLDGIEGVGLNYEELRRQTVEQELPWPFMDKEQIGEELLPSLKGLPAPLGRASDARDPYVILGLRQGVLQRDLEVSS
jgi:hypothetical protein